MSIIKSFSVGNGDMFYIKHGTDNFTVIDCCLCREDREAIVAEIIRESSEKNVVRFLSTSPDNDHIKGLTYLDDRMGLRNFYVVRNEAKKNEDNEDFERYCALKDSNKAFYIYKGCKRKWMNDSNPTADDHGSSGIEILWPDPDNRHFKEALQISRDGGSPNNISPIFRYSLRGGASVLWLGDLEFDFMEKIKGELDLSPVDIVFAPHHGRDSGKIPTEMLVKWDPKMIIIGEAPSHYLNYYSPYNTITQNMAGDIILDCVEGKVHVYVSAAAYKADYLQQEYRRDRPDGRYLGTLYLK